MPDAVFVCDAKGRIVYANRRAEAMSGYPGSALLGRTVEMLVPDVERGAHRRRREAYGRRPRPRPMGSVDHDYRLKRADGTTLAVDIALGLLHEHGHKRVIAVVRDITQRVELEAALAHRALHDPLTGLANRTLFFDRLGQAMLQARRDRSQVALVMLDLNNFKAVNDAHGHQVGDAVLVKLAGSLARGLRATDTVARIGGDEFAWVLPGVSGRQAAMVMMAKLLAAVPPGFRVERKSIEMGVSGGMAIFPDDATDVDTLLHVADVQLYAAKRRAPRSRPRRT